MFISTAPDRFPPVCDLLCSNRKDTFLPSPFLNLSNYNFLSYSCGYLAACDGTVSLPVSCKISDSVKLHNFFL